MLFRSVAQLGEAHPLLGDTDRLRGEALAALGERRRAESALRSAAALTRAGYGPAHPHSQRAALSLARFRAQAGAVPDAAALRDIDAITRLHDSDAETAKLRWRARAYAAGARCRAPASMSAAKADLQVLRDDVTRALPEGGELVREIAAIHTACAAPAPTASM